MKDSVLEIGQLNLSLPSELDNRAKAIGKILSEQLAKIQVTEDRHIASLKLRDIQIHAAQSNIQIAKKIVNSVKTAIDKR